MIHTEHEHILHADVKAESWQVASDEQSPDGEHLAHVGHRETHTGAVEHIDGASVEVCLSPRLPCSRMTGMWSTPSHAQGLPHST